MPLSSTLPRALVYIGPGGSSHTLVSRGRPPRHGSAAASRSLAHAAGSLAVPKPVLRAGVPPPALVFNPYHQLKPPPSATGEAYLPVLALPRRQPAQPRVVPPPRPGGQVRLVAGQLVTTSSDEERPLPAASGSRRVASARSERAPRDAEGAPMPGRAASAHRRSPLLGGADGSEGALELLREVAALEQQAARIHARAASPV